MGRVYRNCTVPIPPGSLIYGGKVFDPPKGPIREILIGYVVSPSMMYPNDSYFRFHRSEWLAYNPDGQYMVCPFTLKVGLYSLIIGAAQKMGVYSDLVKIFGSHDANMIMDYVMFLISERDNATYLLKGTFTDEVTFTGDPCVDSTYSKFWPKAKNEDYSRAVLDLWLKRCIADGLDSVYLAIDGSNVDCDAEEIYLAEPGDAKSKREGPIVGFIWAVQADGKRAGLPITYFLTKGGIIDSTSINAIVTYLKSYGITVKGVLCDRGFCDIDTFLMLIEAKLPYVIMIKKNTLGFKSMVKKYASQVKSYDNFIGDGLFGVAGKEQIFKDSDFESPIALFLNPVTQGFGEAKLLNSIFDAVKEIEDKIKRGVRAAVPEGVRRFLRIEGQGKGRTIIKDTKAFDEEFQKMGFFCIASYEDLSPSDVKKAYDYRMIIEKAFAYLKSQLGSDVFRVFTEPSARMKFFVSFIASLLRYDIQKTCGELKLKTNQMITEMGDFQYNLFNKAYAFVDIAKEPHKQLLNAYGISVNTLKDFGVEITQRYIVEDEVNRKRDNYNILPWVSVQPTQEANSSDGGGAATASSNHDAEESSSTNSPGAAPSEQTVKPKHPGGRPKGSLNKATIARQAKEAARRKLLGLPEPEKPKVGRPKGSKDSYQRTRSTKTQMAEKRANKGA